MTEALADHITLKSFDSREALDQALSADIARVLDLAVAQKGWSSIAFSGGSTPADMLEQLSRRELPWSQITATLVDERWVEPDDLDSNENMLHRCLLQNAARDVKLIGLKTEHGRPEQGITETAEALTALWPLDCVHLGMGTDGHTASWFADAPEYAWAINQTRGDKLIAVNPRHAPHARISLTAKAVLESAQIILHITGEEKRRVLDRALNGDCSLPISVILNSASKLDIYWAA